MLILEGARLLLESDGYRFTFPLPLLDGAHSSPQVFFLNLLSAEEEVLFLLLSAGARERQM